MLPYMPTLQPYRGKPAVRNDRGDRGNVGIIRSPVRASILPDWGARGPRLPGGRLAASPSVQDGRRIGAAKNIEPIRDLAILAGAGDKDVFRWFTPVVALLLDPAEVRYRVALDPTWRTAGP